MKDDAERRAKALLAHRRGDFDEGFYRTASAIEALAAGEERTSDQVETIIEDVRRYLQSFLDLASQENEWMWLGYLRICALSGKGADNPLLYSDGPEWSDVSEQLIASACGGDVSADFVLCQMGASSVGSGDALPPRLRWYIATKLKKLGERHYARGFPEPSSPEIWPDCHADGRPPHENIRRDLAIVVVIDGLVSDGSFKVTRNEERKRPGHSACTIVTEALKRMDIDLTASAVAKIWKDHKHLGLSGLYAQPGRLRLGHTLTRVHVPHRNEARPAPAVALEKSSATSVI